MRHEYGNHGRNNRSRRGMRDSDRIFDRLLDRNLDRDYPIARYDFRGDYRYWDRPGESEKDWGTASNFAGMGPEGYRRSDERIREEACEALTRDPAVDARNIQVEVKDSIVILKGNVTGRWMKRRAEDCLENISGLEDVRNELTVTKESSGSMGVGTAAGSYDTGKRNDSERKRSA